MSEYLSKKAVLEYTKQNAAIFFDLANKTLKGEGNDA